MQVRDLTFDPVEINGRTFYRSTQSYTYDDNHYFCIAWPFTVRQGSIAKIGVYRGAAHGEDHPGNGRPRTWFWNLSTRELENSNHGPPYRVYPPDSPNFTLPQLFWMILDIGSGQLSFGLDTFGGGAQTIGVAFNDLDGDRMHVVYTEEMIP